MEIHFGQSEVNCHSPGREAESDVVRRLVGLVMVAWLVAAGVAVAAASSGGTQAPGPAQTPALSPIPQFFSLIPPRPQKPRVAPRISVPSRGYSCAIANGSPCSRLPCGVFVAGQSAACTVPSNRARRIPTVAR